MLREAIRAPGCDVIHVTEIETSFNVTSSSLLLIHWYSPSCMETMQARSPFPIPIFSLNLSNHSINPLPVSAHAWLSKTPQIHPPTLMRTCKSGHLSHTHTQYTFHTHFYYHHSLSIPSMHVIHPILDTHHLQLRTHLPSFHMRPSLDVPRVSFHVSLSFRHLWMMEKRRVIEENIIIKRATPAASYPQRGLSMTSEKELPSNEKFLLVAMRFST